MMASLYLSTTQLMTSLPQNDNIWHKVLSVVIPTLLVGQIIQVAAEQEVTNPWPYLAYVGAAVTATGFGLITASMAQDIANGNHAPLHRGGAAVATADMTNVEVDLWIWAGSNYGSDPLTVEQAGYGRLSVCVL